MATLMGVVVKVSDLPESSEALLPKGLLPAPACPSRLSIPTEGRPSSAFDGRRCLDAGGGGGMPVAADETAAGSSGLASSRGSEARLRAASPNSARPMPTPPPAVGGTDGQP